jgi:hypothetical protein
MKNANTTVHRSGRGILCFVAYFNSARGLFVKESIRIFRISALLIVVPLGACTRSSAPIPEAERARISKLSALAYLPPKAEDEAPMEFISEIDQQVQSELKNRGYNLLDQDIVKIKCSAGDCQNLPANSQVDAVAHFTLNKVRRINALIGHFNEVAGTLTISNTDGTMLTAIREIIRERGGLLFNAGQIIKGIVSSVQNTAKEKYALLGAKLARNLALQLPIPAKSAPVAVSISSVTASYERGLARGRKSGTQAEASTVCLNGTPHQIARLKIDGREVNMIEISPGRYCRTIATEIVSNSAFSKQVELRSTFGVIVRQSIPPLT